MLRRTSPFTSRRVPPPAPITLSSSRPAPWGWSDKDVVLEPTPRTTPWTDVKTVKYRRSPKRRLLTRRTIRRSSREKTTSIVLSHRLRTLFLGTDCASPKRITFHNSRDEIIQNKIHTLLIIMNYLYMGEKVCREIYYFRSIKIPK